jgi:hypothetical protein
MVATERVPQRQPLTTHGELEGGYLELLLNNADRWHCQSNGPPVLTSVEHKVGLSVRRIGNIKIPEHFARPAIDQGRCPCQCDGWRAPQLQDIEIQTRLNFTDLGTSGLSDWVDGEYWQWGIIYYHTREADGGKNYIGQTTYEWDSRWRQHVRDAALLGAFAKPFSLWRGLLHSRHFGEASG